MDKSFGIHMDFHEFAPHKYIKKLVLATNHFNK